MSKELGIENVDFIESDIMEFKEKYNKKYDMVFTAERVLYLNKWADSVKHLLNENGVLYVLDDHSFFMAFDTEKLKEGKLEIKYPYFDREPEYEEEMHDYASENKMGVNYGWMYKVSDIINSLARAGLTI